MDIVFQSVVMGALVIIAACAIVFPVLFLVPFHRFRKDFQKAFMKEENNDEL